MKKAVLFTYLKAVCTYMYHALCCYDASTVLVLKNEPAILGPIGMCKYTYTWHNRVYNVILNTN